jgi:hypothetical protein
MDIFTVLCEKKRDILNFMRTELLWNVYNPKVVPYISFILWSLGSEFHRNPSGRNVYRLLAGKPEGRRPLGRPRRRWIDNIKMDILEIGLNVVDWIGLAQDRYRWRSLVNVVMNFRVP